VRWETIGTSKEDNDNTPIFIAVWQWKGRWWIG
jgi:hypothetical protein